MTKAVLKTIAVSPLLLLLASACDDADIVGAESSANTSVDSPQATGGDESFGDTSVDSHQQLVDVDNGDPWLAQLDHVWVGEADTGYVIEGYDANDVAIGRIRSTPRGRSHFG